MEYKYIILLSNIFLSRSARSSEIPEIRLQKNLFKDYNPNVRPVLNHSDPITVTIDLELRKIQHLDEVRQSFKAIVNILLYWKDEFLTWNETQYNGLSSIEFPFDKNIWIPDIMIYNALEKPGELGMKGAFIRIFSNGQIIVWTQINSNTACEIKTKKYPYDQQICRIDFGKFMSPDRKTAMRSRQNEANLLYYAAIAEWEIKDNFVTTTVLPFLESYDNLTVNSNFTYISFTLKLRRSCRLCFYNIILPVLVLAVLDMLSFFVPCESGEKTSYPVSMFLTLAVFLTIITQSLPESVDGVSYLSSYVTFQLAISSITLMSSVFSLHLYYKMDNTSRVSKMLHFLRSISKCEKLSAIRTRQQKHTEGNCSVIQQQNKTDENSIITKGESLQENSYAFDRLMFYLVLLCQFIGTGIFIERVFN